MVSEHPCFLQPDTPDIKLWRYMDLAKFLTILQQRAVFFSRASLLGDPFEGSFTKVNLAMREYIIKFRDEDQRLEGYKTLNDDQIRDMFSNLSSRARDEVDKFFISCWHMNGHESAAMWNLYSRACCI